MKKLLPLLGLLLLTAQDCEQPEPGPDPVSQYCSGNDYTISGYFTSIARDVQGAWDSILMGEPSADRRATVRVRFGEAYCSGVVLGPRTVLTAGHCGYAADTTHNIHLGGWGSEPYREVKHVVHPDYLDYVYGGNRDLEKRKADLMLVFVDRDLPEPYVGLDFYTPGLSRFCAGLVAQGWGRWEGDTLSLRETRYIITDATDPKYLISRAYQLPDGEDSGRICFGDSGGPLYADVNGVPTLAGITTTTMSSDCLAGGTHVNAAHFSDWVVDEIIKFQGEAL